MKFESHQIMQQAINEAAKAGQIGEVPVGAIIISNDGKIISKTHNLVEANKNPTHHAEMLAISEATKVLGYKSLSGCTIFVTLEPCAMCASAISQARISKLVYGAKDEKGGAVENGAKIYSLSTTNHKPEIISGILEEECGKILVDFFKDLRKN